MCAKTRTDDHTLAANLTIVVNEDDEIPEFQTEEEHVENLAEKHLHDRFGGDGHLRGSFNISVDKVEDFDTKDVWEVTCNVMF